MLRLLSLLLLQRLLRRYSALVKHQSDIGLRLEGEGSVHGAVPLLTVIMRLRETSVAAAGIARHASQRRRAGVLQDALQNRRAVRRRGNALLLLLLK